MTSSSRPLSRTERWIYGGACLGIGSFCVWLALSDPSSVNGPWWLGASAGVVFLAAGLAVGTQGTPMAVWVGPVAVGVIFLAFAAMGNWIAFGPGPRACTGGISFLFFSGSRNAGDVECRVAFGIGAVILDALVVMGLFMGAAKAVGNDVWSKRLEKVGTGVLGVALSPLILLAILISVFGTLKEKAVARWKGGA